MTTGDATDREQLLLARAYLLRVAEPPALALHAFVGEHGAVTAACRVREGRVPADVADETAARRHLDLAAADLLRAREAGAELLVPEDTRWPAWALVALSTAAARGVRWSGEPLGLWVRGPVLSPDGPIMLPRPPELPERAVAVVGARAASGYGDHLAAEFGHGLGGVGYVVVSGAAYGVDGAAHRGCLAAAGVTVAVLACGIDVGYPAGHARLLDRIAERGALISEYPPGTPPARHRFLVRNRLIAALAAGTLVVEAGRRSGARNTATTARELGRPVMAVPGPVTSAVSAGCHEMVRAGQATLVTGLPEVLEVVGRIGTDLAERPPSVRRHTDGLDGPGTRIYEALPVRSGAAAEQLAQDSGVPLDRVRAILPALELAGLAVRGESGWRRGNG